MAKNMRMLRMNAANDISIEGAPIPDVKPGTLLVRVSATTINPSDLVNLRGGFPENTVFPRVPGRDFCGIVEKVGEGIDESAWLLQRVFGTSGKYLGFTDDGAHAEYFLAREACLTRCPSSLTDIQGTAVGVPFTTAEMVIERSSVQGSETVLVIGANGSVGSAVCLLLAARGCKILKAGRSGDVDVNTKDDPELKQARELSPGGLGPDVVVDTVGDQALARAAIAVLSYEGRYAFITAPRGGDNPGMMTLDMKLVYRHNLSLIGSNSVDVSDRGIKAYLESCAKRFENGSVPAPGEDKFETITLEEALEVYKGHKKGSKKFVVSFKQ